MFRYSILFFALAMVAALFGFGGIDPRAASVAQILFYLFLLLFVGSFLFGAFVSKKKQQSNKFS